MTFTANLEITEISFNNTFNYVNPMLPYNGALCKTLWQRRIFFDMRKCKRGLQNSNVQITILIFLSLYAHKNSERACR